jgi:aldehyde dehydrogenase (NAD(P)+)
MVTKEDAINIDSGKNLSNLLVALDDMKHIWANTPTDRHIKTLEQIKKNLMHVSKDWVELAAKNKGIPENNPLVGEEWMSGPYALMSACNAFIETFSNINKKDFQNSMKTRELQNGQLSVTVIPASIWDRLILSGVTAEVWMQPEVKKNNFNNYVAKNLRTPLGKRKGKVALVLGAGNIASIAPLDCFQKLFLENQVVLLKLNPVNDYLFEHLNFVLDPLISIGVLKIIKGNGEIGQYLTQHDLVEEIHITGSAKTHDKIVWGQENIGSESKKKKSMINSKRITSELGAVCPTIVVPGPWSNADIKYQADNIATQKMHNAGYNCIACQVLILPKKWKSKGTLMNALVAFLKKTNRVDYYPGSKERIKEFCNQSSEITTINNGFVDVCVINDLKEQSNDWHNVNEVFAQAISVYEIDNQDPTEYLKKAISYSNEELYGTLGANILIHPSTIRKIGKQNFERIIQSLRYGTIAINGWSALGFLLSQCPWGAYPGHKLEDIQSGIGTVHNTLMLSSTERSIIWAPWRPFPRGLLSGQLSMLPKPPWFISNKRQDKLGLLLTSFEYNRSWLKIPRIFFNALLG